MLETGICDWPRLTGLVADAGKLRRLSCSPDDFIYFLPVTATIGPVTKYKIMSDGKIDTLVVNQKLWKTKYVNLIVSRVEGRCKEWFLVIWLFENGSYVGRN